MDDFNYRSIGMVRPLDKAGRVVIPASMRRYLDMEDGKDNFEIYVSGKTIVLRKSQPCCVFCEEFGDSVELNGMVVCKKCVEKLRLITEQEAANRK